MIQTLLTILRMAKQAPSEHFDALPLPDKILIKKIQARNLTYLSSEKLALIVQSCREIERQRISGHFIEAGCALGGSSILISKVKATARPLGIYDVFGIIPPPTEQDTQDVHDRYKIISEGNSRGIAGDTYYGYQQNLIETVASNFASFQVDLNKNFIQLIKGLVQDTLLVTEPVAFAHIDVDWYEPVKTCLERICPSLAIGGFIILDDYHDWGGCRKATDEYLINNPGQFQMDDTAGSLRLKKIINSEGAIRPSLPY